MGGVGGGHKDQEVGDKIPGLFGGAEGVRKGTGDLRAPPSHLPRVPTKLAVLAPLGWGPGC